MGPSAISGLPNAAVAARIGAILQRFDPERAGRSMLGGDVPSTDLAHLTPDTSGFDPFGEAYQLAVEQRPLAPAADWSGSAFGLSGYGLGIAGIAGTGVPGSSIGRIGGFGEMPVPAELQAYGNGRIPQGVLQPVGQGGHQLYAPAAASWRQAVQDAAAQGIELRLTDSYRSYDEQVDLVRRKGLYSEGGYGATPGTSNHGWGLAVDVDVTDAATLNWLRANAWRYGFVEAVPREPWHWEYRPHQA